MSKLILFYYLIILLISISSCHRGIYPSLSWQNSPVVVDGNMNEWPNPLRFYDSKSKINYSFTNDRKNLYVCLKISDESTQRRMMQSGMEIYIDTSGKNVFPIVLKYPVANSGKINNISVNEKKTFNNIDNPKLLILNLIKEMEVKGFKYPVNGTIPFNNQYGIAVSINADKNGVLVYEAKIPFATIYKDELTPSDTNKVMAYKIQINEIIINDDQKSKEPVQDDRNNIVGKANVNNGLYGNGGEMNVDADRRNRENTFSPSSEPMEIHFKMKFAYQ